MGDRSLRAGLKPAGVLVAAPYVALGRQSLTVTQSSTTTGGTPKGSSGLGTGVGTGGIRQLRGGGCSTSRGSWSLPFPLPLGGGQNEGLRGR